MFEGRGARSVVEDAPVRGGEASMRGGGHGDEYNNWEVPKVKGKSSKGGWCVAYTGYRG
jgi:hypothetical protein